MQAIPLAPNLFGRRLTGAVLHALVGTGLALPGAATIASLRGSVVDPHGAVILLVMLVLVVLFTLVNLAFERSPAFAERVWGRGHTPRVFDDALTAREKLAVFLKSGWCLFWLAVDLFWLWLALEVYPWN